MAPWLRVFTALAIISLLSFLPSFGALADSNYKARSLIAGNETDRISLLAFKADITHDPLEILSSWNDSTHFCEWLGVACNRRHQRVKALGFNSSMLAGTLSPHIGNLSFLRILDLGNNYFTGSIPQQLGQLPRLRWLALTNNTFSGEILVNFSHPSNIQWLYFDGNRFSGRIPEDIGRLSQLEEFFFDHNKISGVLPSSMGNLSSLTILSASYNSLSGVIPKSLGKMKKLKFFGMAANNLTGLIPASLYNISSLIDLSVSYNQLEGSLPPELGLWLPNIEFLEVASNYLKGNIPVTISNASKLVNLDLAMNEFSGQVPPLVDLKDLGRAAFYQNSLGYGEDGDLNFLSGLANCSYLEVLQFGKNKLGGFFPEYLSNFSTRLRLLDFAENKIWGSIPAEIGNLVGLNILYLASNQLTATVPKSICRLKKLVYIYLQFNELSGKIPSCLGNLSSLLRVYLSSNNLDGEIPTTLGCCRGLLHLGLSHNKFSGTLPREIMSIPSLLVLSSSSNRLTGPIPFEISKLIHVGILELSNNFLSSEIPTALGGCTSLETLNLRGNLLQGKIPQSLSSLRAIRSLDLSRNNLSGTIPKFLGDLKLLYLNLSFNDLEGAIPLKGSFRNASVVFLSGNEKICGGFSDMHLPQCSAKQLKHKRVLWLKLILPIAAGIILLTAMSYLICVWRRQKVKKEPPANLSPSAVSVLQVSYATLLNATGGFSSDNLIGRGSSGSVYKAFLEPDTPAEATNEQQRQIVAVKVFNTENQGTSKSFITECEMSRNIRHRNVVKILTSCSGIDFQGNDFKALVYEFMENGSLEGWLHPILTHDGNPRTFGLLQRLNISLDVACVLDYLHHGCETPIVHYDLKPSNVLLDGEMTARLGDFGLARFLHGASCSSVNNFQSSSIVVRGTVGYTPPENGMGGGISTSGDIYSYGILLLEMFTGKRPTDNMFTEGLNLRDFVETDLSEGLVKVVDPVLLQEQELLETNEDDDRLVRCLSSVFKIGLGCSVEVPWDRLDISDVAAQLSSIRSKFLRAGTRVEPERGQ